MPRTDGIGEVELRHSDQRVMQRAYDAVDVLDLLGKQRDGAGEDTDGLHLAIHEVIHVPGDGAVPHPLERPGEFVRGHMIERLADPGGQVRAPEAQRLGGRRLNSWCGVLRV